MSTRKPTQPTESFAREIFTKVLVGALTTLLLGAVTFGVLQLQKVTVLESKLASLTMMMQNIPTADTQNLSTILHSLQNKSSNSAAQIKMLLYILVSNGALTREERSEILSTDPSN